MTDTAFEKMLHNAFSESELPDSLSKENVLAALQNVEPVRPVYGLKRYIAAAAAVMILLGLSSVLFASGILNTKKKNEMFSAAVQDESYDVAEPEPTTSGAAPAEEPKDAFSAYDPSDAEIYSANTASLDGFLYDEEMTLEKGSSAEVTLPFEFGNGTEICYYDAAGSRTDEPCCSVTVSERIISINGISVGETLIEFNNGTDTCTIKVSVSEGSF